MKFQFSVQKVEPVNSQTDIELFYVIEGSSEVTVEDRKYLLKKDDFMIINADRMHSVISSENILSASIFIPCNELMRLLKRDMAYKENELIYNRGRNGQLMEEHISGSGNVAYFEGGASEPGTMECSQWLDSIINDTDALVKPEQAFTVTQILDAIYRSDREGKEIRLS